MKTRHIVTLFILMGMGISSYGQDLVGANSTKYNKFYVGLNGGTTVTFANIKQNSLLPASDEIKFGGGFLAGYQISPIVAIQGQFIIGTMKGVKSKWIEGATANQQANTFLTEFNVNTIFSLNKWLAPTLKINHKLDIYGLLGVGLLNFNSRLSTLDKDSLIKEYKGSNSIVFPIGMGVKYKINEQWNVGIETSIRPTLTDKLDAFVLPHNPNDKYSYTSIGVNYIFGKNDKALEWVDMVDFMNENNPMIMAHAGQIDQLTKSVNEIKNINFDSIAASKVAPVINMINNRFESTDNELRRISNKVDSIGKNAVGSAFPSIYFAFGKTDVSKENQTKVANVALFLKNNPNVRIRIVGHTDKTGSQSVNEKIAKSRVENVVNLLINEYSINASRIESDTKTNTEPLSNKQNSINRRVDFIIVK